MSPHCCGLVLCFGLALAWADTGHLAFAADDHLPSQVVEALEKAGDNGQQLQEALIQVPNAQRQSLTFLLENMPTADLQNLDAKFLLEHVALAHEARDAATWGKQIPDEIFLNDLLPYASVNERRDAVRAELRERFWPKVRDCDSISTAAARLNQLVFKELNVRYSTKRRRADQGPRESMDSGLASCTGLSILLIDACRACGVPARFVGTPLWTDNSGNHSWVEIWEDGWHFTGAAEPTGERLDEAWFTDRASGAQPGRQHGIFAVSFRRTNQSFPLVWLRGDPEIWSVEVTERYAKPKQTKKPGMLSIQLRALQAGSRDRCQANLTIRDHSGEVVYRGQTKDEQFDANDHLNVELAEGDYTVELRTINGVVIHKINADVDGKLVSLEGPPAQTVEPPYANEQASAPKQGEDDVEVPAKSDENDTVENDTVEQLNTYLQTHQDTAPEELLALRDERFARTPLTGGQAAAAVARLSQFYRARVLETRLQEHEEQQIMLDGVTLKYDVKQFGEAPAEGHCLVISMHGGGGAPARVNDRQWENQKKLYKLEAGIYVAPRAPTDTWNLWHQAHIDPLFTRLIANMIAFEGVDPERIYLTGYSAGGDGVYQLAPRMADQLAAAAMMAGHPNETKPLGLRNLAFALHVGGKDGAYDRNSVAKKWADQLAELAKADPQGYVHWAKIHEGKGHWMDGDDAEGVNWMLTHRRGFIPRRIVWLQDDVTHDRFYWLAVDKSQAAAGQQLIATHEGNRVIIERVDVNEFDLLLRDDMMNLDQPVIVERDGEVLWSGDVKRTIATVVETLVDRGDPHATFTTRVKVIAKN